VTKKSTNQYRSRMGQKTGTSNTEKNVMSKPTSIDLSDEYLGSMSGRVLKLALCMEKPATV
jgi:hypothetical protein